MSGLFNICPFLYHPLLLLDIFVISQKLYAKVHDLK